MQSLAALLLGKGESMDKKTVDIVVISRVERSEADSTLTEICESVTINGKIIKIPQGCTASITHIHKS